jgi:hypothetical protein
MKYARQFEKPAGVISSVASKNMSSTMNDSSNQPQFQAQ